MRVLVCGGRDYQDRDAVWAVLDSIHEATPIEMIYEGGARGADALAAQWAHARDVPRKTISARWDVHGKAAGPIRNQEMIGYKPDLVLAFPGGRGTADMVQRAEAAGIQVRKIP